MYKHIVLILGFMHTHTHLFGNHNEFIFFGHLRLGIV